MNLRGPVIGALALSFALGGCTTPGGQVAPRESMPGVIDSAKSDAEVGRAGEATVRRALDALGLTYAIDPDGDFELIFRFSSGRQQRVYVWSEARGFDDFPVREIRSYAFELARFGTDQDILRRLLDDTLERELGGWAVDGPFAVFVARIPAASDAETLQLAVEYVAFVADEMERQVFGGIEDQF